jgi:hypothetical protein
MPFVQEQNGFIECDNQTMMETTRNILHVKGDVEIICGKKSHMGHDMNFG